MKAIGRVISSIKDTLGSMKKHWAVILGIVIVGLLIWIVFGVYVQGRGWADWTGFGKYTASTSSTGSTTTTVANYRTLWDWLDLLIIPIVLAIGAWALNKTERESERETAEKRAETDREIALDRQRQVTLQAYYDRMTDLLLEKGLRDALEDSPVRDVARTQTLAILRGLDSVRKGLVVQFLYEADLINIDSVVVSLKGADLSGTNLCEAYLRGVDLDKANLRGADLGKAHLIGANLCEADLRRAYLFEANLWEANLSGAYLYETLLSGAYLYDADLVGADLSGAYLGKAKLLGANLSGTNLRGADLAGTRYDANTQWPEGFDPEAAGAVWEE